MFFCVLNHVFLKAGFASLLFVPRRLRYNAPSFAIGGLGVEERDIQLKSGAQGLPELRELQKCSYIYEYIYIYIYVYYKVAK